MKRDVFSLHHKNFRHAVLLLLPVIASIFIGCTLPGTADSGAKNSQTATETASSFDSFLNDFFCDEVSSNTINLHFTLADPEGFGISNAPITLGNISEQSIRESNAKLENTLSVLATYNYDSLSLSQQLTYDVLTDYLNTSLASADFTLYDEILKPSTGIQAQLPVLYEEYRFYDEQDIKDYLKLLPLTESYFEQIIAFEKQKSKEGLFMSDFACTNIIAQCQDFIKNQDRHYLIETFEKKVDSVSNLSDAARSEYKQKNSEIVKKSVLPAYQKLADALKTLLGSGKNEMGLCYLPNGKAYYKHLVYSNTGCSAKISEIQDMIENQRVSDLTESALLSAQNPNIWQECNAVSLQNTDSTVTLNLLQDEMETHFPKAPNTSFTVSFIDECMEEYMAPAFYITAPIDNYKNNSIFINASTDASSMQYFTTLAHEGFPGHLYQTVMSYDAGLAPIRSTLNYPGYVEGWATYVEMLSYQYAGLDKNVADLMSLNQSALLSLYASTDIGIHGEGWSFADTVSFWSDYGITNQEALRNIYELIVEEPAHYLKYYVGYLNFLKLKEYAKETFGNSYNDIAFHQAVLAIGPAPFDIVKKYLDDYYDITQ